MGQIKVLDVNMINMIAAGEVIERPASVVKELVENSIDAGATKITISIADGGQKSIIINDNGSGMDAEDLKLAFCPHATSKIKDSNDLMKISTMGFRGEALASIGSIAQVAVTSKTAQSIEAYKIEIDCGDISEPKPSPGSQGTTIEVRNIFYKLPARRKFLRTASTEFTHICEQFKRIALAKGGVTLILEHNGRETYRIDQTMGLAQRIAVLFGKDICDGLFDFSSDEKGLQISGLAGKPQLARANSKYQYLFLNGRFIRDKFITHALKEAYRSMMEPSKFPIIFMFFDMPAESFDVNVHPTKIEVRFDNPNLLHSQVLGVLREKLLNMDLDVVGKFENSSGSDSSMPQNHSVVSAMKDFFDSRGNSSQQRFEFKDIQKRSDSSAMHKRDGFYDSPSASSDFGNANSPAGDWDFINTSNIRPEFIQIHDSYIITEISEGFMIIDQHALHERIIYERLCKRIENADSLETQKLLVPETFDATAEQIEIVKNNQPLFKKIGMDICEFGPGVLAVQSFPTLLGKVSPVDFVVEMLDLIAGDSLPNAETILHKVLDMTACKAAIKAGQRLTNDEMKQLLSDKDAVERASRCPHGRPTTIKMNLAQLEKQFGRT